MTEELVTLKTAKILKEKGFNEFCKNIINYNGKIMETVYRTNNDLPKSFYSCPTQSIAQKWLRETKKMHICIIREVYGYGYDICKTDDDSFVDESGLYGNDCLLWHTYEEALEAGLQEALKLI